MTLLGISPVGAGDWPAWRGPAAQGIATGPRPPLRWSAEENVQWRLPLPERGNSTPIVWKDRVYLTQAIQAQGKRMLLCIDRATGRILWEAGTVYQEPEPTHETNPYCSASPVTDGQRIYVSFGSAGLFCYDLEGKEVWRRDFGKQHHVWGNAASPMIWNNLCILNVGPGENTRLVAMDRQTGRTVWEKEEPGGKFGATQSEWIGSWSTPLAIQANGRTELVMTWPGRVCAYDPATGAEWWSCSGLKPLVYTSPLHAGGVVVAMGGFLGPALAVRAGGEGDVTETRRLWFHPQTKQRVGSGVIHEGHVYILNEPGVAECIELETGRVVWEERVAGKGPRSTTWSSLVLSDGMLYGLNQSGDTVIFRARPQFEMVGVNSLGEPSNSSVVIVDGQVFIRTFQSLWCVAAKDPK